MNITIGENIRIMRRKCGFTQEELAERLAVTPQAVSKWENNNGTPDISQLVPLAQIFGITTDSLLGAVSATYGNAHTEAALGHEQLLMSTSQPEAEKHLAAYSYFRAESEKEPTNYTIMRKCINHAAEISRYVDFENFLSDNPELRDEIFADCERKNRCISRYCEDRATIEKSDYAMIWIYIHIKEFDKANALIERLPSLESNNLKEHIMTQFVFFQHGFEKEKPVITEKNRKILCATGKAFVYDMEDYAWFSKNNEAPAFAKIALEVIMSYKGFDELRCDAIRWETELRRFMPKIYSASGDMSKAAQELLTIAQNFAELHKSGWKDIIQQAQKLIDNAVGITDEPARSELFSSREYNEAVALINSLG